MKAGNTAAVMKSAGTMMNNGSLIMGEPDVATKIIGMDLENAVVVEESSKMARKNSGSAMEKACVAIRPFMEIFCKFRNALTHGNDFTVVTVGDWNCTTDFTVDRNAEEPHIQSSIVLDGVIKTCGLIDPWREKN